MWTYPMYNTTKVTLELREVVDNGVDMWKFDYPSFYTGTEKKAFEQKVIDHYYTRQIGFETVGRFLHHFRSRVREIMPYYVQLYKTIKIMDDLENPFDNVDILESWDETTSGRTTGNSGHENTTEHRGSDTPQGSIANLDAYMSEAAKDSHSSETTSEATHVSTFSRTYTKKGNQGVNTYAHDMLEYRQTLLNIDQMIIDDLNCLFLAIY